MYQKILLPSVFLLFLFVKFSNLSVRLSDTNVYIGMADAILKGQVLYKDIFLTNLPLFPYVSAAMLAIAGGNVWVFYATGTIFACCTGLLLYLLSRVLFPNISWWIHFLLTTAYLFSFTVLATSDHQTGIFFATSMALASYLLYLKKKYIAAGVLLALCFMTKGYFLPIIGTFLLYDLITRKKASVQYIVSFVITCIAIFIPTLLFAFPEFLEQVFGYSLSRGAGINKMTIIFFFILRDWLIAIGIVTGLLVWKRQILLSTILASSLLFLFLYKDVYYFYLNMFLPFACLSLVYLYSFIQSKINTPIALCTFVALIGTSILLNLPFYFEGYAKQQQIQDVHTLVRIIKEEQPDRLYGPTEVLALLSYLSRVPLLNNIIDPNTNMFRSGVYSAKKQTESIFKQKTLVISFGAEYPTLKRQIISEIYDPKIIETKCKIVYTQPVYAEDIYNRIHVWRCY